MSEPIAERQNRGGLEARPQQGCFVCGQENPHGLRIRFEPQDDGEICAQWRPAHECEGFTGIVHGGIVSTVLDEAMSKAVAATKAQALTAELRVRFRHHVVAGQSYLIRGWVVKRNRRLIETEASLATPDGREHAHAWGRFLTVPGPCSSSAPATPVVSGVARE